MSQKTLLMYGRAFGCYDQARAMAFLDRHEVPYQLVDIGKDREAAERLHDWVGHLSVPTLLIGDGETGLPLVEPAPLDRRRRVRGQDRGSMITEPSDAQLRVFLERHGLLAMQG